MYVVLLDDFHLDDLLFVQSFGRLMAGADRPCVLVHGDGGVAVRALEAQGVFAGDDAPEAAAAVRAALRFQSKKITGRLTDAGLSGVGFQGADRRLLVRGADGVLRAGPAAWLARLVATGAVPVVSALAADDAGGEPVPVAPAEAVAVLAAALAGTHAAGTHAAGAQTAGATAVLFTRGGRPGMGAADGAGQGLGALAGLAADLGEPGAAAVFSSAAVPVLVTSPPAFFAPGGPLGAAFGP